MRIQSPVLYFASGILFYLVFLFVPYIVASIKKGKYFKEYGNFKVFFAVLKLQLIFLFFSMIIPFLMLFIVMSFITHEVFLDIFSDKNFLMMFFSIPVMTLGIIAGSLTHLAFFEFPINLFLLVFIAFLEVWRRVSLSSLKKNLPTEEKEVLKKFLLSITAAVILFFFIGHGILLMLHSKYFYCDGNILCKRTSAYYNN